MFKPNTATLSNLLLWIIIGAIVTTIIGYALITMPHDSYGLYNAVKDALISVCQ